MTPFPPVRGVLEMMSAFFGVCQQWAWLTVSSWRSRDGRVWLEVLTCAGDRACVLFHCDISCVSCWERSKALYSLGLTRKVEGRWGGGGLGVFVRESVLEGREHGGVDSVSLS